MNISTKVPKWVEPAIGGGIVGALIITIVGFSTGWVVNSGTAQETAERRAEEAVLSALTPVCVAQFKAQVQGVWQTKLAALEAEDAWQRGDYVEEQGWATMPGSAKPSAEIADACATELMKLAQKGAA